MTPSVSVVIPMFNAARYIGAALDSVRAQTEAVLEVIVVDDASTDDGPRIVDEYGPPVRCVRQPKQGISGARNAGVTAARGEYLAFLDADDLWTPDKIARQLAVLRSRSTVDMVFGHVRQFRSPELRGADRPIPNDVVAGVHAGTLLLAREAFLRVGLFSLDTVVTDFLEWYARATDAGLRVEMLPDVVMHRRIHDGNNGIRQKDARSDYARILKQVLDRRRQMSGRTDG